MKPCLPAPALILSCGCAEEQELRHREMEAIAVRHEAELRRYEELRAEFAGRNPCPRRIEFPGQETMLVHECSLRDASGAERSESSDARLRLGLRMGPDSSYTTFTEIGLEGLTRIGQLEWSIDVKSDG